MKTKGNLVNGKIYIDLLLPQTSSQTNGVEYREWGVFLCLCSQQCINKKNQHLDIYQLKKQQPNTIISDPEKLKN